MTPTTNQIAPEDVRPGVWLMHPTGKLIQVAGILENRFHKNWEVYYKFDGHPENHCIIPLSDCSPVPLSGGVLQAAGFDYMPAYGAWANKHHWVSEGFEDWQIDPFCTNEPDVCIKIKSLHELQNICRDFKTDLQINAALLLEAVKQLNQKSE